MGTIHKGLRLSLQDVLNAFIDRATYAVNLITYEHHEIHAGSHYYVSGFETEATDGTIIFGVTTPDSEKWIHMTFEVSGVSRTELAIHEGAEITGGSSTTPINNNRNSDNVSGLTVVKDPTINDAGDLIYAEAKGLEGTNPVAARSEGIVSRDREIILKQNTTYTFTITSRDDDNHISYIGEWYEHTNKETV